MALERNGPGGVGQRGGMAAIAAMLGFVAGGVAMGAGAPRLQAAGVTLLVFGTTLWFAGMRASGPVEMLDERTRRQRHRSLAIGLGLAALVAIFYAATLVRLGPNAIKKDPMSEIGKRTIPITDPIVCKQAGTC